MLCAKCNYDNPADALFCMKCGAKVENRCSSCYTVNPAEAKFCRKCGGALGATAPASSPSRAADAKTLGLEVTHERQTAEGLEGERKTVTVLFADIKGSTELMRDLDPEEARAIVDPVLHLMMAAVHRYGGYVAQSTGDGIFAIFGAPIAHEDHPQRALHAALAMQEELRRYAERMRKEGKIPVEARVGTNTGEVVVRTIETGGHTEYTPVGHVTNLAARMQTAARGFDRGERGDAATVRGLLRVPGAGAYGGKGTHCPGRGVRGDARRGVQDALRALGTARADAVRRARARDGGDGRRVGAGQGGPRANRGGSWRGGRG
jgi:class 3 adenylate cyclase/ribosomal protein L40E